MTNENVGVVVLAAMTVVLSCFILFQSVGAVGTGIGFLTSCDVSGNEKNIFGSGETVYVIGYVLAPDPAVDVYVVNCKNYSDGDPIGPYIVKKSTSSSEVEHVLTLGVVGNAPGQIPCPGKYDIVYDKNQNGYWNESDDLIDHEGGCPCPGFKTLPLPVPVPVGTAVPVGIALIIVGLVIFRRRKF